MLNQKGLKKAKWLNMFEFNCHNIRRLGTFGIFSLGC